MYFCQFCSDCGRDRTPARASAHLLAIDYKAKPRRVVGAVAEHPAQNGAITTLRPATQPVFGAVHTSISCAVLHPRRHRLGQLEAGQEQFLFHERACCPRALRSRERLVVLAPARDQLAGCFAVLLLSRHARPLRFVSRDCDIGASIRSAPECVQHERGARRGFVEFCWSFFRGTRVSARVSGDRGA